MDVRQQRIENEWSFLQRLAQVNPRVLLVTTRTPDEFLLHLRETGSPLKTADTIQVVQEHEVRLCFTRFFPTVPMEAYLSRPVFHPNVHPNTGFVCLWQKALMADTVVEALIQLQRVLSYSGFTEATDHVMQPDALEWAQNPARGLEFPLQYTALTKPPSWDAERNFRRLPPIRRKRLS
jgi:ubiquitin-protein ligase